MAAEDEKRWIADLLEQKVIGRESDQTADTRHRLDPMMSELTSFMSYSTRARLGTRLTCPDVVGRLIPFTPS